ncbi:MAG: glycerol kinase GlpK [Pseudomonadota bacterium]
MSSSPLILAIDQGTTSSRAIVFDRDGKIRAAASEEFPQLYPQDGWVEHDPEAIWRTCLDVSRAAIQEAEKSGERVAAIAITNQRETTIVWDRGSGAPIHNAIVWQDRRTSDTCERLKNLGKEDMVATRTGLLLDPYFSATKIAWLLDHVAGARERAEAGDLAFGTVDAFLISRLTNGAVHATDATNASRTSLFDINKNDWDDDLLALFDVPRAVLPEVKDCAAHFGDTAPEIFGRPIPILGVAGDQQAAAFGQACFSKGDVKSTYGTGCFALLNTGSSPTRSRNKLLSTIAWRLCGETAYALEGSIFVAGAAVQWLRDGVGVIQSAEETEKLATSIDTNQGVYMVPAFTGLGAPHWAPNARASIVGLTRGAGRAALARAALEAVVYQTADLMDAMAADAGSIQRLRVDGGMVANDWLLQFLADILDTPVDRPRVMETTALGAAYLAGLQAGIYQSTDDIAALWAREREFTPKMAPDLRAQNLNGWAQALATVIGS